MIKTKNNPTTPVEPASTAGPAGPADTTPPASNTGHTTTKTRSGDPIALSTSLYTGALSPLELASDLTPIKPAGTRPAAPLNGLPDVHVVWAGYDTICISIPYDEIAREHLYPALDEWQYLAWHQGGRYSGDVLSALGLQMTSHTDWPYRYNLLWPRRAYIGISPVADQPIYIHLFSEFLYTQGKEVAWDQLQVLLTQLFGVAPPDHVVSRTEFAIDVIGLSIYKDDIEPKPRARFRTRLPHDMRAQDPTTGRVYSVTFGKRGRRVSFSLYDKTRHCLQKRKGFYFAHLAHLAHDDRLAPYDASAPCETVGDAENWDSWRDHNDDFPRDKRQERTRVDPPHEWRPDDVMRVEAQAGRDYLRDHGIRHLDDINLASTEAMLRDLLGNSDEGEARGKLLYCDRTNDSNANRWPASPIWISIRKQAIAFITPAPEPEPQPDAEAEMEPAAESRPAPSRSCLSLVVILTLILVLYLLAFARRLMTGRAPPDR